MVRGNAKKNAQDKAAKNAAKVRIMLSKAYQHVTYYFTCPANCRCGKQHVTRENLRLLHNLQDQSHKKHDGKEKTKIKAAVRASPNSV